MKITVCIGSSCHLKGSRQVVEQLQALVAEHGLKNEIELAGTFCIEKPAARRLQAGVVARGKLEQMAAYRNEYAGEEDASREKTEAGKNGGEDQL